MRAPAFALILTLATAAGAAGQTLELRPHPAASGPLVTLADLFEGVAGPAAGTIVARAPAAGRDAILDAPTVQALVRQVGYDWANAGGYRKIVVASASAAFGPARPSGRRPASVLVYARNLAAGEVLRPEDLRWSAEAIAGSDAVGDPDLAIGKATRRPLREGDPAAQHDLLAPLLIHRNDPVSVVFEAEGVSLTLQAKALGDASRGQVVEVQNPSSTKIIQAVCSGPDQAAVGPRADALKSDGPATDRSRIAALQ